METLRVTVSSVDIAKQDEKEFQGELTERLIIAGFDLDSPIIKQPRNDCAAVDFIQFKYGVLDRFDVWIDVTLFKIKRWFKHNFSK